MAELVLWGSEGVTDGFSFNFLLLSLILNEDFRL